MTPPTHTNATTARGYDVVATRAHYPALTEGLAHFDGPGGTQAPTAVSAAVSAGLHSAMSNRGGAFAPSRRSDATVEEARRAVADLTGAPDPQGVVIAQSMTAVTYVLAGALAKTWRPGDEVVVSRLDHDANIRPWVQAADRAGATVRWANFVFDPQTCELPVEQYDELLTERTRLVALTGASNAVGTRPDVPAIAAKAHAADALVYVDGVHLTPHAPVDVAALGADFYTLSSYKFSGPHLGMAVADPALLERLRPDKLLPAPDTVPGRFEHGTPAFELLAGLTAAVDFLAALAPGAATTRRERLLASMAAVEAYECELFSKLYDGLRAVDGVTTYGAAQRRAPTVAFTVAGRTPREVAEFLGARGVCVWDGHYYAIELVRRLGLLDSGGMVRAGLSLYTDASDVDRLLAAVAEAAACYQGAL